MTASAVLLVALGAAVGAPLRFAVERRLSASWPWGTWIVNVSGSAVLGALAGWASTRSGDDTAAVVALVGTGFCGALTTFGGYAAQTLDLLRVPVSDAVSARSLRALGYAGVSVLACVAVAGAAYVSVRSSLVA